MKKILAGRISKPFGAGGELVVNLYDTFPAELPSSTPVWVVIDGLDVPLFFEKFDRRGRTSAVVAFADIDTQRRAAEFVGKEIFLEGAPERQQHEDDKELYLEDLAGYRAYLGEGLEGEVAGFIDSDMNPLFEISVNGQEALIPAVDEFIEKIDRRRKRIWFSLPEGLLMLNE